LYILPSKTTDHVSQLYKVTGKIIVCQHNFEGRREEKDYNKYRQIDLW